MVFNNPAFFSWLLAASISLVILWALFVVFFRNWTHFSINRWIIVGGTCACMALPLVSSDIVNGLFTSESPVNEFRLNRLTLPKFETAGIQTPDTPIREKSLTEWFWSIMMIIYWSGVVWMTMRSLRALARVRVIKADAELLDSGHIAHVWVQRRMSTFSFGKNIFLHADTLALPPAQLARIRRHEEAHVMQRHSADNVFFEILSAIFWVNPFVGMLSRHLRDVHEFLADQWAVGTGNQVTEYQELLVTLASGSSVSRMTHPFSDSQFFRRIVMLHKPKTQSMENLKLFLLAPACAAAIFLSACVDSDQKSTAKPAESSAARQVSDLVISKITWNGNKVHSDDDLNKRLNVKPGDRYDRQKLEAMLSGGPQDESVVSLYMNDGYLFFRIEPEEKVVGDKIELTLNIFEDEQVWVDHVTLTAKSGGNELSDDVRPLLDVKKGQLFNRSLLISSQEKIAKSGLVRADSVQINPFPKPKASAGARKYVDIEFVVQKP